MQCKHLATIYLYIISLMAAGCVGYFGSLMKDLGVRKCVVIVDEVGPCGETAYERTHFQMYKSDGSQVVDGK